MMYLTAYLIIIIIIFMVLRHVRNKQLYHISAGDSDRKWYVANYENKKEAAVILSRAHAAMIKFMRELKKKYHIDETDDTIAIEGSAHLDLVNRQSDVYNIVDHLLNNYNPDVFYENDPRNSTDTSYTLGKGDAMYICIRDKDNPSKFVDDNTLLFTILHECSHIANYNGWDHNIQFWTVFKFILHEAAIAGIYIPVNYEKYPVKFCGLNIEYQPLYDNSLKNLWEV